MNLIRLVAISACTLALATSTASYADLAPPPAWQDTCSVKDLQRSGERCESCRADYRDAEACAKTLGARGLQRRCRSTGASAWLEVWCARSAASATVSASASASAAPAASISQAAPLPVAKKSGCHAAPQTYAFDGVWMAIVLAVAAVAAMRRSGH